MKLRHTLLITLILISFTRAALANPCIEIDLEDSPHYQFNDKIYINSFDGTKIGANLFTPKSHDKTKKYPAIIFVNSWFLEEHEYFKHAKKFAEKGYIVLSYSARGWGCSQGKINVIGKKDIKDLKYIIDWLEQNSPVDMKNIGLSGISYGSGMTLMGLAHDSRIKTGVAMSTWGSLTDSLFGNNTLRSFWTSLLVSSGFVSGELDSDIWELFKDILDRDDVNEAKKWTEVRSPLNFIDKINKRKAPVFLSNSFGDNLFQANSVIKFYHQLKGPKRLELNQGTHASAEGLGLFYDANYTFNNVHSWFDYWLKGIPSKSNLEQLSLLTAIEHKRENYNNDELLMEKNNNTTYHFSPHSLLFSGSLVKKSKITKVHEHYIHSGLDTLASTGIPLASSILNAHYQTPVMRLSHLLNTPFSLSYRSEKLEKMVKLRGIPKLNLSVIPHSSQLQLVAYLYDVNKYGVASLITHGVTTQTGLTPNKKLDLELELVASAYNIKKGHRLAIAIDTFDLLYLPLVGFSNDFSVRFSPHSKNNLTFQDIMVKK